MPIAKLSTGINLHYEEKGAGEPLLLIMGTGADHTFWQAQVPAYAKKYRVITYDARGTGQSDKPEDPTTYSMRGMADDAAALLDVLDLPAAHVSGLSLGSTVAQELAIHHPARVQSVQLHGTWGRSDEWFIRMVDTMEYPLRRGDLPAFMRVACMWIFSPAWLREHTREVEKIERSYILENPHPPTPPGVLGHCHADKTHDALDRLGQIRCPVLITAGENDHQVPLRYAREVAERIPHAVLHVFRGPNASHVTCVEKAEEFNRITLDWLAALKTAESGS